MDWTEEIISTCEIVVNIQGESSEWMIMTIYLSYKKRTISPTENSGINKHTIFSNTYLWRSSNNVIIFLLHSFIVLLQNVVLLNFVANIDLTDIAVQHSAQRLRHINMLQWQWIGDMQFVVLHRVVVVLLMMRQLISVIVAFRWTGKSIVWICVSRR